jgi:hypothetical protein
MAPTPPQTIPPTPNATSSVLAGIPMIVAIGAAIRSRTLKTVVRNTAQFARPAACLKNFCAVIASRSLRSYSSARTENCARLRMAARAGALEARSAA